MSLRVAVAVFVLLALAVYTVGAALDERDRVRADSSAAAAEMVGEFYAWPDADAPGGIMHLLVVREFELDAAEAAPFGSWRFELPPADGVEPHRAFPDALTHNPDILDQPIEKEDWL